MRSRLINSAKLTRSLVSPARLMRPLFLPFILLTLFMCDLQAQEMYVERLSTDQFDVLSPAARVEGPPGAMQITNRSCQSSAPETIRGRIVDVAVQEWGFFGFPVVDETKIVDSPSRRRRSWRRMSWLNPEESGRVAHSIAGYWSVTPDGRWILSRQNDVWMGRDGIAARWRDPWSAAFISWVMCESGSNDRSHFRRAIAHHTYIDQAIEAGEKDDPHAAFVAFEVGQRPVEPGDLLCFSRRPRYQSVAERREDLGDGIRSHCDFVVKVEPEKERILAIGGNVRGAVRMKLLPAVFADDAADTGTVTSISTGRRTVFAHLKLQAEAIPSDSFDNSPTMSTVAKDPDLSIWVEQQLLDGGPNSAEPYFLGTSTATQ